MPTGSRPGPTFPSNEKQLEDIRKLAGETLKAKKEVRDRLEKLVKAGTDPEKDLAAAKADYLQAMVQSQKDEHEAQTNLNNAKRTLATLERQLFQAGMDPDLLANPTESTAIVAAEVPEGRIGLVGKGPGLHGASSPPFPDDLSPARVRSLAPTISKERRTLRVFFQLSDPQGRLKPGMFAEIGLGTDLRKTLRIPADGVLHVGQSDYVLVGHRRVAAMWKVTEDQDGRTIRQPDRGPRRSATGRSRDRGRGHSPEALCRPGRPGSADAATAARALPLGERGTRYPGSGEASPGSQR